MATATKYNPSYRYGESNPVKMPWKSGVAVNVGDLVFADETDGYTAKPAMSLAWPTALTGLSQLQTAQYDFAQRFLGVAGQQYDGSNGSAYGINDGNLRVDTGGVFDFACPSQTFNAGDLVTVAQDGSNNNLAGQTVTLLATAQQADAYVGTSTTITNAMLAIGRVAQAYSTATTIVRVQLLNSRYGAQAH